MVELESSSVPYTGRSVAKRHVDRSSKRHNKRGGYRERCKKDI